MHHLVKARRYQAAQCHNIGLFLNGPLYNNFGRAHYAQIDYRVVVASQHYGDDILAYIVHVSLYGCNQYFSGRGRSGFFFPFDKRLQYGDGCFHCAGRLDHLRQEHLARSKQIAHFVHGAHQRSFDYVNGTWVFFDSFVQIFFKIIPYSLDHCIRETFLQSGTSPCGLARIVGIAYHAVARVFYLVCQINKPFSGVGRTEHYRVVYNLQPVFGYIAI